MTFFRKTFFTLTTALTLTTAACVSPALSGSGDTTIRDHRGGTTTVIVKRRPDLGNYCSKHHRAEARLTAYSATDWVCARGSRQWGISVKTACKEQFGLPVAKYDDRRDPYSWYCTRPEPKRPGVDLSAYCRKHFGTGARAKLVGGTALDWVCTAGKQDRWGISVRTACKEQHGLPRASYENRNDPYSWYCHR